MSARRTTRLLVGLATAASAALLAAPAAVAAGDTGLPGMCSAGRPSPSTTLNAHANGPVKFVLNLATDPAGDPTGVLILGQGAGRMYSENLCAFWEHVPGQVPQGGDHEGEDVDDSATTAHAVALGTLADGTAVLVRADVRENDEGRFFRVRYRVMGMHGGTEGGDETHEDEAWTTVPAEGWAPLKQLNLR